MATSLLATGVPTEDAYRLASIIQQRLLAARQNDFTAEELVAAVHSILASEADEPALATVGHRGGGRNDRVGLW